MGLDALGTGLAFLPTPVTIGLMSLFVAPRVIARFGPRAVLVAGLVLLGGGLLLLSRAPADPSYAVHVLPSLIIMGLGVGVAIPVLIMLSMAGAAPRDTGAVSGFTNTAQHAGAALGLAALAAVAAAHTSARSAAGAPAVAALRDGYSVAFLVAAGFVLGALLITLLALRRAPAPAAPDIVGTAPGLSMDR